MDILGPTSKILGQTSKRVALFALLALATPVAQVAKPQVDFAREVEPVFKAHCYRCHGVQQQMNGLRLDRREDALRGGYSGPVILPRKSAESRLIQMVTG